MGRVYRTITTHHPRKGVNAWFLVNTFDVDGSPQFFPTIMLNQLRKDYLQCHAML